ncbi:MarR family winged helix-turn-helix transcriptional regulator [Sediminicoccus sp. KRV36]|uniref:MarR family winged helix-turn-helix transcriptional regulator n=1 Tax=Sediminicoccus sp. KRV36 TaxID=3133721 RepID=UPI00200BA4DF|nr:MarR family winged helix-turn-helix transcriptional regulator [Sediminicoccus rosea]UPY38760.1 MarR family winged helix-turn-helix transcriptional regulator [Sediminicoccus rosea]
MPKQRARVTPTSAPLTTSRPALLEDGSDAAFRRLVNGLLALSSRHQALRDGHAARIGLAGPAYSILISVLHLGSQGAVSVSDVAAHMKVSAAFITAETNKLEAAGLLAKRRDPLDGRRVRMAVTPAGSARLAALAPTQRLVNDIEFGPLNRTEFRTLLRLVESLNGAADRALDLQQALAAEDQRGAA